MTAASSIVIVGAGQAGANAAMELRKRGHDGRIVLVGEEVHAPYERPPLSKDALLQPASTKLTLYPLEAYAEQGIELKLGVRATAIDAQEQEVALASGETLGYDKLLLTTGAYARRLPESDALGDLVHVLRTVEDARGIQAQAQAGKRAILVGAGVIGLEMASSLTELGLKVEVVDPALHAMSRNVPEQVGLFLQAVHESRGVRFHFGTQVKAVQRIGESVRVTLDDGTHLEGELLVYGVGVHVDDSLAKTAGLVTERGAIVVDEHCRTSHPGIYAAGDAVVQIRADGQRQRIETWENANLQSLVAVCDILGQDVPEAGVPWFWTDQCGLNIQFAGNLSASRWIVRGEFGTAPFLLFGLDAEGAVMAAITVNQGRDMRSAKDLIAKRARLPEAVLADTGSNLRNLAKAA